MISSVFRKIFGTKNDREVKKYIKRVAQINALEPTYEKMSDDELKIKFNELKAQLERLAKGCLRCAILTCN